MKAERNSQGCSIFKNLGIEKVGADVYGSLKRFHYRDSRLCPQVAIYAIKDRSRAGRRFGTYIGVIVYTMPAPAIELRNIATDGFFCGLDAATNLQLVNANIRNISRVIIEPHYRGLGLAGWLVAETMPRLDVAIVESLAVMGSVSPFFEQAGMTVYRGKGSARVARLTEALGMVGVDRKLFIDPAAVQRKLDGLCGPEAEFIARQIYAFLEAYGRRKHAPAGVERTRFVLSKLSLRPVYYIWFNPEVPMRMDSNKNKKEQRKEILNEAG